MRTADVAIIGNGLVGRAIAAAFKPNCVVVSRHGGDYQIDCADHDALLTALVAINPKTIINCAGYKDFNDCEIDKIRAFQANTVLPETIVSCLYKLGTLNRHAKLIHISTDYVFNGENGHYNEGSLPRPTTVYGQTKLAGEAIVGCAKNSLIIRTGGLLSLEGGFLALAINKLATKQQFDAYTDAFNSPTDIRHLCRALKTCIKNDETGVRHISSKQTYSRHGLGLCICEAFGFDQQLLRKQTKPEDSLIPRNLTLDTVYLDNDRIQVTDAIHHYVAKYKKALKDK